MGPDRNPSTPRPKILKGIDADQFLRQLSARQERETFARLAGPNAKLMPREEAEPASNNREYKRGFRSGNPFSIY